MCIMSSSRYPNDQMAQTLLLIFKKRYFETINKVCQVTKPLYFPIYAFLYDGVYHFGDIEY